MSTADGCTIEIRHLTTLSTEVRGTFAVESATEGFRFITRLVGEWDVGAARFDGPGEALLGAYAGPDLIAIGGLTPDPYGRDPGVGRLRHVYVRAVARRRGVGRALVRALEAGAAAAGYRALVLRTDTPGAAHFYEVLGYARLPLGGTATHRRAVGPPPYLGGVPRPRPAVERGR